MKWIVALLACIGIAQAQIVQHNISDDGYAHVPLQFAFPYYGRTFTDSYMFSNGVVGFGSVNNHWCCTGYDLANARGYQFNFSIMPLQTDLINYGQGRFLTEGTPQFQRYVWENISEYGRPNNLNTFGLEIRPSGFIGMYYEKVNLDRPFTIGMTGDTALGEYTQHRHQNGLHTNQPFEYLTNVTGNICLNPLASPSCPGYQEAYTAQQCSANPLYSPSCVGYEFAYHDQQCSLNPLYATTCQGYSEAYHSQQCSLNPLYATTCSGYRQAYYNQQCSLNPLYDSGCVGYEAAYFNQQCGLNPLYNSGCQGYETAYFNYQCTQNALYNSQCQGYEQAYLAQQCGISQLYSAQCPNYAQAYFSQQCSLNGLYDRNCPNYAEAYALANVVTPAPVTISAPVLQVSSTGTVSIETPVIADPVVNEVVTRPTTTAVATTRAPEPVAQTTQPEKKIEEKKETKQDVKPTVKPQVKMPSGQVIESPNLTPTTVKIEQVQLIDLLSSKIISKPLNNNARAYYLMNITGQQKHEEMIEVQYGR